MAIAVPISPGGTFTIPPEIRKRLGVDQLQHPILLVEERDGKLYLEPAAAVPVRDIPKATLRGWIRQDEAVMAAFKKKRACALGWNDASKVVQLIEYYGENWNWIKSRGRPDLAQEL